MGMLGATGNRSWSGNFPLLSFVFVFVFVFFFFLVCLFLFEVALFFSIVSCYLMGTYFFPNGFSLNDNVSKCICLFFFFFFFFFFFLFFKWNDVGLS
jgi:hypothetical protein